MPVLLLSGELDPVTPPEYGDQVAAHFPRATHLVAPGQGHIVTTRGCMGDLVSEFIIAGDFRRTRHRLHRPDAPYALFPLADRIRAMIVVRNLRKSFGEVRP